MEDDGRGRADEEERRRCDEEEWMEDDGRGRPDEEEGMAEDGSGDTTRPAVLDQGSKAKDAKGELEEGVQAHVLHHVGVKDCTHVLPRASGGCNSTVRICGRRLDMPFRGMADGPERIHQDPICDGLRCHALRISSRRKREGGTRVSSARVAGEPTGADIYFGGQRSNPQHGGAGVTCNDVGGAQDAHKASGGTWLSPSSDERGGVLRCGKRSGLRQVRWDHTEPEHGSGDVLSERKWDLRAVNVDSGGKYPLGA